MLTTYRLLLLWYCFLAFGNISLITLGLAREDTIRKNRSRMNRMSFNAPLCSSADPFFIPPANSYIVTGFCLRVCLDGSSNSSTVRRSAFHLIDHLIDLRLQDSCNRYEATRPMMRPAAEVTIFT